MTTNSFCRRAVFGLLTGLTLAGAGIATPIALGVLTPAQAQVSGDFRVALDPYGHWAHHPRWGEVWVPDDRPPGWRPYKFGHWIYTDEWGWYWISDRAEEDWGWITYHYGRWVFDRHLGWIWVRGEEWAPAWVDWRRGSDYVGWAPLPPDDAIYEYDDDPTYWVFVRPRYITAPRIYDYVVPPQRTVIVLHDTVVINRTVVVEHDRNRGRRFAVNPGVAPGIIAAVRRNPVPTYRVRPRVLPQTTGIPNAVQVSRQDLGRRPAPNRRGAQRTNAPVIQRAASIAPAATVAKPEALRKDERGRLGSHPPRAAQGATIAPAAAQPARRPQAQRPQPPQRPGTPSAAPAARPPSGAAAPSPAARKEETRRGKPAGSPAAAPQHREPPPVRPAARPAPPPSAPTTRPSAQVHPLAPPRVKPAPHPAPPQAKPGPRPTPAQAKPVARPAPPHQARPAPHPAPPPQARPAPRPAPQARPAPRPAVQARPAPRPAAHPAPRPAPAKKPPPKKGEEKEKK